jgi:hypothetical protein
LPIVGVFNSLTTGLVVKPNYKWENYTTVSNSTKRSDNFSEEEAQLLVSLAAQNKHIVEKNKKHKTVSLAVDLCAPKNSPATNDPVA